MIERNTAVLLQEWGVWLKYGDGHNLRARSAMQMIMPLSEDDIFLTANITDDEALEVDKAMAKLKLHRPDLFRVLWLACVCGYSMRAVGSTVNLNDKVVARLYECGYTWVDFVLNVDIYLAENDQLKEILLVA